MMPYIYLLCAVCGSAMLSIMSTLFGRKNTTEKDTSLLYALVVCISVTVSWGVMFFAQPEFETGVLIYSLGYSICYIMAMVGMFNAYKLGSVSLTAFIKQLSLIGVALWGFVFWQSAITANIILGLVLIVVALYLCFRPQKGTEQKGVSLKWLLYAGMLLVGNAGCSIIQKYQQMAFDGRYGNQLMFVAACFSSVGCYIPFNWAQDFSPEYLRHIKYCCLVMSESYIREHFADIKKHANVIENRLDDEGCTPDSVLSDNAAFLAMAQQHGLPYILIDDPRFFTDSSFFSELHLV